MALYHLSAKIIGRQGGRRAEKRAQSGRVRKSATNSIAAAAYRSGDELRDERNGSTYRYARAERVMHTEIIAPSDAPEWATDRAELWNSVEANERRKDAQLAREIEVALPQELDLEQQRKLLCGWVSREFTPAGAVVDFAIHHDRDGRNPHAHVMTTMRSLGPEGWSKQKLRQWEDRTALANWRASWERDVNTALERAGRTERVDHRSYAEQDADKPKELRREPTRKVGPWAVGGERERENLAIKARNRDRLRKIAQAIDSRLVEPVRKLVRAAVPSKPPPGTGRQGPIFAANPSRDPKPDQAQAETPQITQHEIDAADRWWLENAAMLEELGKPEKKRLAEAQPQPVPQPAPVEPEPQVEAAAKSKPEPVIDDDLTPAQLWQLQQKSRGR